MESPVKTILKAAAAVAAICSASLLVSAPASAYSDVSVSVNSGDVAFAYRDGWYDHDRRWHRWHDDDEWSYYRRNHWHNYHDWDHDRDDYWRSRYRHHRDWDRYRGDRYYDHDYNRDDNRW